MAAPRQLWRLLVAVWFVPAAVVAQERYTIAVNTFLPVDLDVFVADGDGTNARPLFAHPAPDYNASLSANGEWVLFTSERGGSADIYRGRSDGTELTALVDGPAFDDQAALSPDGRRLAFVSSRDGQADLFVLDLATRQTRALVTSPAGEFRPRWSADGEWLAFTSDRDPPRATCAGATVPGGPGPFITPQYTSVFVVRADGSQLRRVTSADEVAASPAWAPSGTRLVYYSASPEQVCSGGLMFGTGTTQIVSLDVASGDRTPLTAGDGVKAFPAAVGDRTAYVTSSGLRFTDGTDELAGEFARPSWSLDGRTMAFHRDKQPGGAHYGAARPSLDGRFGLSLYSDAGSFAPDGRRVALIGTNFVGPVRNGQIIVASPGGADAAPIYDGPTTEIMAGIAWSPLGNRILFGLGGYFGAAERLPARIMSVHPDGSGVAQVTDGNTNDGMPSFSPDGNEIVFRVASAGARGLYILNLATKERRKLATGSDYDTFPSWSPRGDWITFTSFRDGDYEIYRIRPDGTGLQRLTDIPGNDAHSTFSPDGEWIAFTTAKLGFKDESLALTVGFLPPPFQAYGEIAVMRADGSELRLLTDNSVEDGWPVFVPRRN